MQTELGAKTVTDVVPSVEVSTSSQLLLSTLCSAALLALLYDNE